MFNLMKNLLCLLLFMFLSTSIAYSQLKSDHHRLSEVLILPYGKDTITIELISSKNEAKKRLVLSQSNEILYFLDSIFFHSNTGYNGTLLWYFKHHKFLAHF